MAFANIEHIIVVMLENRSFDMSSARSTRRGRASTASATPRFRTSGTARNTGRSTERISRSRTPTPTRTTLPPINLGAAAFDAASIVDVPLTDFQRDILLLGDKRMAELIPEALVDVAAELLTRGHAGNIIGAMSDAEKRMRG